MSHEKGRGRSRRERPLVPDCTPPPVRTTEGADAGPECSGEDPGESDFLSCPSGWRCRPFDYRDRRHVSASSKVRGKHQRNATSAAVLSGSEHRGSTQNCEPNPKNLRQLAHDRIRGQNGFPVHQLPIGNEPIVGIIRGRLPADQYLSAVRAGPDGPHHPAAEHIFRENSCRIEHHRRARDGIRHPKPRQHDGHQHERERSARHALIPVQS